MLDENEHSRKEDGRSLHRLLHKAEQQDATVVVDSAAFFSELPPEQWGITVLGPGAAVAEDYVLPANRMRSADGKETVR